MQRLAIGHAARYDARPQRDGVGSIRLDAGHADRDQRREAEERTPARDGVQAARRQRCEEQKHKFERGYVDGRHSRVLAVGGMKTRSITRSRCCWQVTFYTE